ncbi:hypothetical protein N7509_005200 [Penicillium cosmopolitanum]|uniref:Zn(2)-C6 fungal-type domain-containing protein n=1 Tax=Penicillium cosmopolitanum TaxID=1131564 RepID=A0A9W9W231_9EURO|nr:uncharacterized protein N7509_005200 [Penicillium cosmopolitanum]KAJ5397087.1 hypothetical protein N7509_005200 [Penicillium cosmopolitanum]
MDSAEALETCTIPSPHARRIGLLVNAHYKGRVRTGCLTCRSRKVKCDEQRPSCQKCIKLKKTCIYGHQSRRRQSRVPEDPKPGSLHLEEHPSSARTSPDNGETLVSEQPFNSEIQTGPSTAMTPQASDDALPLDQSLLAPLDADASQNDQHTVDQFYQEDERNVTESPSRFELTSQHIFLTLAMDLGPLEDPTLTPYRYFIENVESPIISPFDSFNWNRIKIHVAQLGFKETCVATSILAVQALYRAQADRLPMSHAMSLYQAAAAEFESISSNDAVDFNTVLVVVFLLSLSVVTLPNEDSSVFGGLDGQFVTRLETWLLTHDRSPVSLRIGAWLQFIDTATKRAGNPGLLPGQVSSLLQRHVMHPPSLSLLERDQNSTNVLYDTVSAPLFDFYLELQKISNRVADLSHYRRSRITPTDQAEVTEISDGLKTQMSSLWEARPGPLRLLPGELRDHLSHTIVDPLIALAGFCTAAYLAEVVALGRTLGDPPFASPEAIEAMSKMRDIVEGDWNASSGDALNPGYLRPLFVYAIESLSKEETLWAQTGQTHRISRASSIQSNIQSNHPRCCHAISLVAYQFGCDHYNRQGIPHHTHSDHSPTELDCKSPPPSGRPQLQFLSPQPLSRPVPPLSIHLRKHFGRLVSTTSREHYKKRFSYTVKTTLTLSAIFFLFSIVKLGVYQEDIEHKWPSPPEWSWKSRWCLRSAQALQHPEYTNRLLTDWPMVAGYLKELIERLENVEGEGAGIFEQGDGGFLVEGVGLTGLDISAKSEPWRRGYFQALLGAAKAAENLEGWLTDKKQRVSAPAEHVIGPSNPRPKPMPAAANYVIHEEDCEVASPPPEKFYMKILTTNGFETNQKVEAALAYADWLDYKAAGGIEGGADNLIDLKTGVLKNTSPEPPSENLMRVSTALAVHNARQGDLPTALSLFTSVLKAWRSLPLVQDHQTLTPPTQGFNPLAPVFNLFSTVFIPAEYPPASPTGNDPPTRTTGSICHEAGLMAYIGEILYASSSREHGLAWTRDAVEMSESTLMSLHNSPDLASRGRCAQCLKVGLENWRTMVSALVESAREEQVESLVSAKKAWYGGANQAKDKAEQLRRWEAERDILQHRIEEVFPLLDGEGGLDTLASGDSGLFV